MSRKFRKMKSDTVIAIAANATAVAAFFISVWTGIETRRHNRLSVRPLVAICTTDSRTRSSIGYSLSNGGAGPAIIRQCIVYVDRVPIEDEGFSGFLTAIQILGIDETWVRYSSPAGYAYCPGEGTTLLCVPKENQTESIRLKFIEAVKRIKIRIEYESIYGERFVTEKTWN